MDVSPSADHDEPSLAPRIHISDGEQQAGSAVDVSADSGSGTAALPASDDNTTSRLHVPLDVKGFIIYQLEFSEVCLSSVLFQKLLR